MFAPALNYCHLRNPDSLTYVLTWFFVPGPGVRGAVQAGVSARRWRTMVHFSQPTQPGRKRLSDSVLVSYILPLFFGSFFSREYHRRDPMQTLNSEIRGGDYGGTGGHVPPTFWLGDAKVNVPPLIAHLVKVLGHNYFPFG